MDSGRLPLQRSFVRWAILALGLILGVACALAAQLPRMLQETLPADAEPIQLNADYVATWKDAGQQVFLLRGNVIVSQGTTAIRSGDMVVWVDMQRYQTEQIFSALVYGDKSISLDSGAKGKADADYGYVRMASYSKVSIKAFKNTTVQQDMSSDPVYQRALAQRPADPKPAVAAGSATNGPSAPKVDENLTLASALQPPPLPPPAPPVPMADPKIGPGLAPPDPKANTTTNFQPPPAPPNVAPVPDNAGNNPSVPPAPGVTGNGQPIPPGPFVPPPPTAVDPAKKKERASPQLNVRPRYKGDLQVKYQPVDGGMTAVIISGGVALLVTVPPEGPGKAEQVFDIEADRVVIWTKGNGPQVFDNMKGPGDESGAHEVYLAGHVELRSRTDKSVSTLRADEVYYDFRRSVAVARKADFEMVLPKVPTPIHFMTDELKQTSATVREARQASIFSTFLPSDPGLKVDISNMTIEDSKKDRSYLYGLWIPYDLEGKRIVDTDHYVTGNNMFVALEGVPVFYFPYFKTRAEDPLGPFEAVGLGYDYIFGLQIRTTWDLYDLLDLPHFDGTRWRLYADYLSARGPGLGTEFNVSGKDYFGIKGVVNGNLKLYGMDDRGVDVLGYSRGTEVFWPNATTFWPIDHPEFRGIATGKISVQEMDNGFSVLGQFGFISDRNFLEQYYPASQLNDLNDDTYLQVKQQQGNWAWTLYGQVSTRDWLTETNWFPKADGYLIGQTFSFDNFEDLFVYNGHAQAGYAQLLPTIQVPFAYTPTDVHRDTLRLDLMQDISMPFYVGPVKLAPYLVGDLTYYSEDTAGNELGRLYGGGGLRWSMPLSRLYPDIQSDLFNVNQIYHKIEFTGNYFLAQSSTNFNNLPQLTRFNDDASDQALRDIRPLQTLLNPANATFLTTSNLFNPQYYGLRRLVDLSPDTLDTIDVLQLGLRQRWQTERGFPGAEHTVDWMTLNLGVSIFPNADRDNFGHTFGICTYDWAWNIGDRTALSASGWLEPFAGGPRVFDVGGFIQRPDSTSYYLGYQQIDPLNAKAVIATVVYPFSTKYALTANTVWDFGNHVSAYSLFFSRMGTDVMVSFGITYNSTVNMLGVAFEVLPNLAKGSSRNATLFPMAPNTTIDPILNQR